MSIGTPKRTPMVRNTSTIVNSVQVEARRHHALSKTTGHGIPIVHASLDLDYANDPPKHAAEQSNPCRTSIRGSVATVAVQGPVPVQIVPCNASLLETVPSHKRLASIAPVPSEWAQLLCDVAIVRTSPLLENAPCVTLLSFPCLQKQHGQIQMNAQKSQRAHPPGPF